MQDSLKSFVCQKICMTLKYACKCEEKKILCYVRKKEENHDIRDAVNLSQKKYFLQKCTPTYWFTVYQGQAVSLLLK